MKSQRAYVAHVLECIGRITEDSDSGRDAVFGSHTLQDAIILRSSGLEKKEGD